VTPPRLVVEISKHRRTARDDQRRPYRHAAMVT
jgi:hypothetical protein